MTIDTLKEDVEHYQEVVIAIRASDACTRISYSIPEIMYDLSLLLSPQIFLLDILFRHRVFLAP